jgi:ribosome biogenesis SPOUT family RNA methylase Rps3
MRLTPARKLQDEHLLNEFEGLVRWEGDSFAIDQITPNARRRLAAAKNEILRRMSRRSPRTSHDA